MFNQRFSEAMAEAFEFDPIYADQLCLTHFKNCASLPDSILKCIVKGGKYIMEFDLYKDKSGLRDIFIENDGTIGERQKEPYCVSMLQVPDGNYYGDAFCTVEDDKFILNYVGKYDGPVLFSCSGFYFEKEGLDQYFDLHSAKICVKYDEYDGYSKIVVDIPLNLNSLPSIAAKAVELLYKDESEQ
jgi:hypothetical protein